MDIYIRTTTRGNRSVIKQNVQWLFTFVQRPAEIVQWLNKTCNSCLHSFSAQTKRAMGTYIRSMMIYIRSAVKQNVQWPFTSIQRSFTFVQRSVTSIQWLVLSFSVYLQSFIGYSHSFSGTVQPFEGHEISLSDSLRISDPDHIKTGLTSMMSQNEKAETYPISEAHLQVSCQIRFLLFSPFFFLG
jgi:hypothetical protein